MATSILDQYNQTQRLISILQDYMDNLEKQVVVFPRQKLEEAVRSGFPVEIYNTYNYEYLWRNEMDVKLIIAYLKDICIPYLESVSGRLHNAISKSGHTVPKSLSATEFGVFHDESGIRQCYQEMQDYSAEERIAMMENCKGLEKALGVPWGRRMSVEEADKQDANPQYYEAYEYKVNCATCAAAYVLRLRGFDIKAKGNPEIKGNLNTWLSDYHSFDIWNNLDGTKAVPIYTQDWMEKNGIKQMFPSDYRTFFEQVCREKGVYVFTLVWNDGGRHVTILQREDDGCLCRIEPQLYDAKKGEDGRRSIDDLINSLSPVQPKAEKKGIMRVDNKLFNLNYVSLFCN